jgi:hypothetical protein
LSSSLCTALLSFSTDFDEISFCFKLFYS